MAQPLIWRHRRSHRRHRRAGAAGQDWTVDLSLTKGNNYEWW